MNLTDKDSIMKAIVGIDFVVHIASTLPNVTKVFSDDEYLIPAKEGTLAIL